MASRLLLKIVQNGILSEKKKPGALAGPFCVDQYSKIS
jgi:hypothetical protein